MYDTLELGSSKDTDTQTVKERQIVLRNFIAFLENPEKRFDMRTWGAHIHNCNTAHCIGGWTQVLFYNDSVGGDDRFEYTVGALIGLTPRQCDALFYPAIEESWQNITSADAVKVLNHLIDTDVVDWSVAGFTPTSHGGAV